MTSQQIVLICRDISPSDTTTEKWCDGLVMKGSADTNRTDDCPLHQPHVGTSAFNGVPVQMRPQVTAAEPREVAVAAD
jgi:hypothetical protein